MVDIVERLRDITQHRYAPNGTKYGRYVSTAELCADAAAEIERLRAEIEGRDVGRLERVRHVKRGTVYDVLGEAEAQVSTGMWRHFGSGGWYERPVKDGRRLTVYRGEDGKLWVRFTDEFRDGRFQSARNEAENVG
jgi:hypothetical protein